MRRPKTTETASTGAKGAPRAADPRAKPVRTGVRKTAGRAPDEEDVVLAPALSNVIGYLLRRSHNSFQGYWMARFRESETPITPVQGGMLVVLGANPGVTQTALARMMNVEGLTLMQSVDRLEQHGYLQRVRRPGDRRSYSLQLTPLGERVLAAIEAFLPVRDADLLDGLSNEEVTLLANLLTRIVERGYQRLRELQNGPTVDPDVGAQAVQPPRPKAARKATVDA